MTSSTDRVWTAVGVQLLLDSGDHGPNCSGDVGRSGLFTETGSTPLILNADGNFEGGACADSRVVACCGVRSF